MTPAVHRARACDRCLTVSRFIHAELRSGTAGCVRPSSRLEGQLRGLRTQQHVGGGEDDESVQQKWQRRFFILYEHGSLSFALDELLSTLPQGTVNLNLCTEITDAEPRTGQRNALCIVTSEQEIFIRGDNKEIINGSVSNRRAASNETSCIPADRGLWSEQLGVFLQTNKQNQKKKRKVERVPTQVATLPVRPRAESGEDGSNRPESAVLGERRGVRLWPVAGRPAGEGSGCDPHVDHHRRGSPGPGSEPCRSGLTRADCARRLFGTDDAPRARQGRMMSDALPGSWSGIEFFELFSRQVNADLRSRSISEEAARPPTCARSPRTPRARTQGSSVRSARWTWWPAETQTLAVTSRQTTTSKHQQTRTRARLSEEVHFSLELQFQGTTQQRLVRPSRGRAETSEETL
ncbi:Myosin phosphatase [Collichthys lucidus]|uniref:Myosin phosphatase n=1 Tax=Collichthys lucidus TaxID=240159 RepID=A0A4U5VSX6_COLLU|nr:Myosin phosphatase [Collichthys lucidus]